MKEPFQLNITETASKAIKEQLLARGTPNGYVRLGIKGGKCSGFTWLWLFEDNPPTSKDLTIQLADITFLIDQKSAQYINNTTIDYEKTIMKSGFKFSNPNIDSKCGCGRSFDIKKKALPITKE